MWLVLVTEATRDSLTIPQWLSVTRKEDKKID